MRAPARVVLCAVVVGCCTAVTNAPPQVVAAPLKSPRHLEYAFSVSYMRSGERHAGEIGSDGSGVESLFDTGGRRGSVDADVTALTNDGGVVVELNEMLENAPRPEERFTCIAYSDGHASCENTTAPISDVENALLSYLGQDLIDKNKLDAQNHWREAYASDEISVVSDYTIADAPEGRPLTVVERRKVSSTVPQVPSTVSEAKVAYDVKMAVPDTIHEEAKQSFRSATLQTTIDLQLTSDSYAKT